MHVSHLPLHIHRMGAEVESLRTARGKAAEEAGEVQGWLAEEMARCVFVAVG